MAFRILALLSALIALSSASSVYFAYAGQGCGTKHTKCRDNLVCEHKTCKVPKGEKCVGREKFCAKGLVCFGKKSNKRCIYPAGPGAYCDKHVPCHSTLLCQDNKCKSPVNGDCKPKNSVCVHGAVCAGNPGWRRCVIPGGENAVCGKYPLQICAAGLECWKHRCVSPQIGEGGNCLYKEDRCKAGLVCVGDKFAKKCVWPGTDNAPCTGRFQVCDEGYRCNRLGKCIDGRAEPGGSCLAGRPCGPGLVCRAGGSGGIRKTCVRINGLGGTCTFTGEFQCKAGLKCNARGICQY